MDGDGNIGRRRGWLHPSQPWCCLSLVLGIAQTDIAWAGPARAARPDVVPTLLGVALVAALVFGLIAIWCFYKSAQQADRAGGRTLWRVARGKIMDSRVLQQGGSYQPAVNYVYTVDGRQLFNDTIE